MSLLLSNYSLMQVTYMLIRFSKTKFFPWNKNIDRNGVNKQNMDKHTSCTEKDLNEKG